MGYGLAVEATFLHSFCTAGLECTGKPLHFVGIFLAMNTFPKYYCEVMTEVKKNPKDLVL